MCYYEPRHWKSTYSWFLGDQNSCHYGLEHLFSNELKFKWEFFYMKWYPNLGNFQKNLIISLVPHLPSYRYITLLWSAPPSDRLKAAPCSLITTHHCLPCSSFSPPFGITPPTSPPWHVAPIRRCWHSCWRRPATSMGTPRATSDSSTSSSSSPSVRSTLVNEYGHKWSIWEAKSLKKGLVSMVSNSMLVLFLASVC